MPTIRLLDTVEKVHKELVVDGEGRPVLDDEQQTQFVHHRFVARAGEEKQVPAEIPQGLADEWGELGVAEWVE